MPTPTHSIRTTVPKPSPKPKPSKNPPVSSASKPARPSPSTSAGTAAKARPKNPRPARRSPLSDLNSGDAAAARPGCFRFLLSSASSSSSSSNSNSNSNSRSASTPRTPFSAPPEPKPGPRTKKREPPTAAKIKKQEPAKKQAAGQFEALTPERKAAEGSTPASGATPPIHASISPEVACGAAAATPACFAAGHHVMPGVQDRRKCRPRGILTIAGEGESEEVDVEPSQASICWLSSPSEAIGTCSTKCGNEASVNWLVSPREQNGLDLLKDEIFVPNCPSDDTFWQFSPNGTAFSGSPVLAGLLDFGTPASELSETTVLSGFLGVQKTPSTGNSISPFSLILKRASLSSRIRSSSVQQGAGGHRYGSAAERTPFSGESWPENVSSAACSGLTATGGWPTTKMDPVVECFEMMNLSPKPGDDNYENMVLPAPLPELSFQFAHAPTPLNSVDLSSFKRPLCDVESNMKDANWKKPALPETRISWREGLVSRIFDMAELDCCKWLSDDEDELVFRGEVEALPDTKFQPTSDCCLKEGGYKQAACGFGSVDFGHHESDYRQNDKVSPKPRSVAESVWAEGFEPVSSNDSDWTLFYKNDLFEMCVSDVVY